MVDIEELSLDLQASIGEAAFAHIVERLRSLGPSTVVEFGSGRSSVRLAIEFPQTLIQTIEHHDDHLARTKELLARHTPSARVEVSRSPLVWTGEGADRQHSYQVPCWAHTIDAIIIDGPPRGAHRGREACLYGVVDRIREGGLIILDDFNRPGERAAAVAWQERYGEALDFTAVDIGHGLAIFEKRTR